ncbi:hormonally up-regulated neu tumor-associated kinase homolog B-like [Physella acuta]|uniref:hormonally up-regulated neu tumor-associated kinase homolog B-like n=1 Tax=Physella acuta TaxID=109671 RepID=UPI0027DD4A9E|nr:hormonally up-regulated neu tumor-associated kinase homolog B-like [Physella acuta]
MAQYNVNSADYEIDRDFFEEFDAFEGKTIGRGSSGMVVLATSFEEPYVQRAVKKFALHGIHTDDEEAEEDSTVIRNFFKEVSIMRRVSNTNIMPLIASVKTPFYLAIVMPYCPKGDLSRLLVELSTSDQQKYSRQITTAVEYLHSKNIIHGDLKPLNVLIDEHDNALVSDFGLSRAVPNKTVEIFMNFGTMSYRAPETFLAERVNPFKADLYSLGVTLWAIALKKKPKKWMDYVEEITSASHLPPFTRTVIVSLLNTDPKKRPNASQILEDL